MDVYASAAPARLRAAAESAARHYEDTPRGTHLVRGMISAEEKTVIKKGPEGPFKGLAMVGDTGLEPVTPTM